MSEHIASEDRSQIMPAVTEEYTATEETPEIFAGVQDTTEQTEQKSVRSSVNQHWSLKILVTLAIVTVAYVHIFPSPLRGYLYANYTKSAERGIYIATWDQTLRKGDLVTIVLDHDVPPLPKGLGLLKHVGAVAGDSYEVTESALLAGDKKYPINRSLKKLPQQATGRYVVPDGYVLFLNEMDDSFDGRYFGPLRKNMIRHKVRLLLSFDKVTEWYNKLPAWIRERNWGKGKHVNGK